MKTQQTKLAEHYQHDACPKCGTPSVPSENVPDQTLRACPKCQWDWFEDLDSQPTSSWKPNKAQPDTARHSPLPWSVQNGAIYDASDNGRVQNVRLCKLVVSSTAIEPQDAALIVRAVNNADKLAEALRAMMHDLDIFYGKYREPDNKYLANAKQALADYEAGK